MDMMQPIDEQPTASTEPDLARDSLDELHDDIEDMKKKVDAVLAAANRSR